MIRVVFPETHASVGLQSMETALFGGGFSNGNSNFFFFFKIQMGKKIKYEEMLSLSAFLTHYFSTYTLVCQKF